MISGCCGMNADSESIPLAGRSGSRLNDFGRESSGGHRIGRRSRQRDIGRFQQGGMVFISLGQSLAGRPPLRPRARAALRPATVHSRIRLRSDSARAEKTWKTSRAAGETVSIFSVTDSKWIFRGSSWATRPTITVSENSCCHVPSTAPSWPNRDERPVILAGVYCEDYKNTYK
jgi:hypothetical protein